jgi:hypothetical protein
MLIDVWVEFLRLINGDAVLFVVFWCLFPVIHAIYSLAIWIPIKFIYILFSMVK